MSEYIRELSYVQNVDIVDVVLGSQDGPQTALRGQFQPTWPG